MKRALLAAACAALMGGGANAADLTLDIQYNFGSTQIEIYASVTGQIGDERGLALLGVDLECDSTEAFNALTPDWTSAVQELQKDAGLTNPGVNAYWGTPSGNNLLQCFGAQNTIGYDGIAGPTYPTGVVNADLAMGAPLRVAAYDVAPLMAPSVTYTLNNPFANVIDDAGAGPVYLVSPITNITYANQSVTVYFNCTVPPEFAPVAEPVKSWKSHGPNAGDLYINLPVAATAHDVGVETREDSITKITIEISEPIQLPALTDIVLCGCIHGPYYPTAVSLDATWTILTTEWSDIPNGQQTIAPLTIIGDGLGDRYVLKLDEVKDIAGNRMDEGPDSDVELMALFGNTDNTAFLSRNKVNSIDLNAVLLNFQGTAGNPGVYTNQASARYDVLCNLSFLSRGKVNSVDYNIVLSHFAVGGTVCATFAPDPACPSPPY